MSVERSGAGVGLGKCHAVLLECLLREPQRLRPDAMEFLQLGGGHIREVAEPRMPGRGQCAGCRCPDISRKARIPRCHGLDGTGLACRDWPGDQHGTIGRLPCQRARSNLQAGQIADSVLGCSR